MLSEQGEGLGLAVELDCDPIARLPDFRDRGAEVWRYLLHVAHDCLAVPDIHGAGNIGKTDARDFGENARGRDLGCRGIIAANFRYTGLHAWEGCEGCGV